MFGTERPPLLSSLLLTGAGPGGGGGYSGALDDYTADLAGAWSVARRMLASYTGPLIRVRRSSDSTEQDIGYDANGDLDTAALLTFCGAGDGFVRYIYDQSGGTSDLSQATASAQHRIVNAGAVELFDGLPSARTLALNTQFSVANVAAYTGTDLSALYRGSAATGSGAARLLSVTKDADFDFAAAGAAIFGYESSPGQYSAYRASTILAGVSHSSSTAILLSSIFDGANVTLRTGAATGSSASSGAFDFNKLLLHSNSATTADNGADSYFTEGAMWYADQTANEAAIRAALS